MRAFRQPILHSQHVQKPYNPREFKKKKIIFTNCPVYGINHPHDNAIFFWICAAGMVATNAWVLVINLFLDNTPFLHFCLGFFDLSFKL